MDFFPNKVTPLSKVLAMILFIALPFIGFLLGKKYCADNVNILKNESAVTLVDNTSLESEKLFFEYSPTIQNSNNGIIIEEILLKSELNLSAEPQKGRYIVTDDYGLYDISITASPKFAFAGGYKLSGTPLDFENGEWQLNFDACDSDGYEMICEDITTANSRLDKRYTLILRDAMEVVGVAYLPIEDRIYSIRVQPTYQLYLQNDLDRQSDNINFENIGNVIADVESVINGFEIS